MIAIVFDMASSTTGSHPSKNDGDIQIDENNLNISMESDHLDPEQKAAHDADTLPMDGPQAPVTKPNDKWSVMSKRCKGYLSPILAKAGFLDFVNYREGNIIKSLWGEIIRFPP